MENQQIARAILTAVGPENITEAYNCMTRLRLRVKAVTVTKEELKKIAGVKGVIMNEGEIHIVLGPGKAENVAKECKALLAAWSLQLTCLQRIRQNPVPAMNRQNLSLQRGRRLLPWNSKPNTKSAMAKNCMPKLKNETASLRSNGCCSVSATSLSR